MSHLATLLQLVQQPTQSSEKIATAFVGRRLCPVRAGRPAPLPPNKAPDASKARTASIKASRYRHLERMIG